LCWWWGGPWPGTQLARWESGIPVPRAEVFRAAPEKNNPSLSRPLRSLLLSLPLSLYLCVCDTDLFSPVHVVLALVLHVVILLVRRWSPVVCVYLSVGRAWLVFAAATASVPPPPQRCGNIGDECKTGEFPGGKATRRRRRTYGRTDAQHVRDGGAGASERGIVQCGLLGRGRQQQRRH